jgi:hypothetical protein
MKIFGISPKGNRMLFGLFAVLGVLSAFDFLLHGCPWERRDLLVLPIVSVAGLIFCLFRISGRFRTEP